MKLGTSHVVQAVGADDRTEVTEWVTAMRRAFESGTSAADVAAWTRRAEVAPLLWLVDGADRVGTAWVSRRRLTLDHGGVSPVDAWSNLSVGSEHRGRGALRALVGLLTERSAATGATAAILRSDGDLYRRFGFDPLTWETEMLLAPPDRTAAASGPDDIVTITSGDATALAQSLCAALDEARRRPGEVDRPGDWVGHDLRRSDRRWAWAERHGRVIGTIRWGLDDDGTATIDELLTGSDDVAAALIRSVTIGGAPRRLTGSGTLASALVRRGWSVERRGRRPGVWALPLDPKTRERLAALAPTARCSSRF